MKRLHMRPGLKEVTTTIGMHIRKRDYEAKKLKPNFHAGIQHTKLSNFIR